MVSNVWLVCKALNRLLAATLHGEPHWDEVSWLQPCCVSIFSVQHIFAMSCLPSAAGLQGSHILPVSWASLPLLSIRPPCLS